MSGMYARDVLCVKRLAGEVVGESTDCREGWVVEQITEGENVAEVKMKESSAQRALS